MDRVFIIKNGNPYPLGISKVSDSSYNFAVALNTNKNCGIILYDKKTKEEIKIEFKCSNKVGNIRCVRIDNLDINKYDYNFFNGDKIISDDFSTNVLGNDKWGTIPVDLRSSYENDDFDWTNDKRPMLSFDESIFYLLHVRGFTKHKSSGVKYPGTFEGVVEKIPYLKEIGITTVEIMPAYNFIELEEVKEEAEDPTIGAFEDNTPKLNYWGYKKAFYFAPKASYAAKGIKPSNSFKNMVKELHANGIELVMQFFFPSSIKHGYVFEVLKYWMINYHVDGFHLMGDNLPISLLATDPLLSNTKIIYQGFALEDIYERNEIPSYKNLAVSTDDYMYNMRRFLKSDEGMMGYVTDYMKNIPLKTGGIHYFTQSNGFTLMDLVSYDRKHNEDNGENNRDGAVYNGSWNCGEEGTSHKKSVNTLRIRQIKNAITLNMITQSTPLILAGDEFGNSQKGNNNPYCLDNSITWLNWTNINKNAEIYEYTKKMISFRKDNKVLHMKESFKLNDYLGVGYPDLSFHSDEAWKLDYDVLCRHFGMLYCSKYANSEDESFIYIAVNMHWTNHDFAIPKLPKGKKWKIVCSTESGKEKEIEGDCTSINVKERSIIICKGE